MIRTTNDRYGHRVEVRAVIACDGCGTTVSGREIDANVRDVLAGLRKAHGFVERIEATNPSRAIGGTKVRDLCAVCAAAPEATS